MHAQPRTFSDRLKAAATKDPKKSLVLSVLVAVLAVMWIKMMLNGGKTTPRAASAMSHKPSLPLVEPLVQPARTSEQTALRNWVNQPLPDAPDRNLFEVKLEYFPTDKSRPTSSSGTIGQATFWDQLAKSIDAQADQQHKREILIQNLRQQAGQLALTSTVMGPHPKAVINGVMVGQGEVVAQFRVIKIEARSAVVERDGVRLEIALK